MGQAKRRKAEIAELKRLGPKPSPHSLSITAIHESGHAVARFLTATLMGREPQDALLRIDMGSAGSVFGAEATTYGHMFSADIDSAAKAIDARYQSHEELLAALATKEYHEEVIAAARAAGADIESWIVAKLTMAVAGPLAEAKARRLSYWDICTSPECQNDLAYGAAEARAAGLSAEQIDNLIQNAVAYLEGVWKDPHQWNAVLTVAASLPKHGTVEGKDVYAAYRGAFEFPHLVYAQEAAP